MLEAHLKDSIVPSQVTHFVMCALKRTLPKIQAFAPSARSLSGGLLKLCSGLLKQGSGLLKLRSELSKMKNGFHMKYAQCAERLTDVVLSRKLATRIDSGTSHWCQRCCAHRRKQNRCQACFTEIPFLQLFFFLRVWSLLRAMTKASPSSPLGTLEPPRGHRLLEHLGASSPNEARWLTTLEPGKILPIFVWGVSRVMFWRLGGEFTVVLWRFGEVIVQGLVEVHSMDNFSKMSIPWRAAACTAQLPNQPPPSDSTPWWFRSFDLGNAPPKWP